ncbi:hypothetical protein [Nitrosopumilus sp.]|uniref:hypothetical protein n=1 Tax=Nitrosopumilus sp. TaxID=2024843 RepID=UPI002618D6E4|nr:hypothetical protein [Nitrosopumilus sp.]
MKILVIVLFGILFLALSNTSFAEIFEVKHLKTIKMEYSPNWYSYNFAICANQTNIPPFEIRVVSDFEQITIVYDKTISNGNCVSFGAMIHSNNADSIYTEIVTSPTN